MSTRPLSNYSKRSLSAQSGSSHVAMRTRRFSLAWAVSWTTFAYFALASFTFVSKVFIQGDATSRMAQARRSSDCTFSNAFIGSWLSFTSFALLRFVLTTSRGSSIISITDDNTASPSSLQSRQLFLSFPRTSNAATLSIDIIAFSFQSSSSLLASTSTSTSRKAVSRKKAHCFTIEGIAFKWTFSV